MDSTSQCVEIWVPVNGFPNTEVSNLGRVRSLFRGQCRIRHLIKLETGYHGIGLQNKTIKKKFKVHRLVAEAFIGERPENLDVNHKDGNKTNNHADNLEYITRSENLKHAFRLGLAYTPFRRRGEQSARAKLTDAIVLDMRERHSKGTSIRQLATDYNVTYQGVWRIIKRVSWSHI